jgi:dTDP-4-amino-4,6-dideoxygalactose transaminase
MLAIDGGSKVRTKPWPPRALFGEEEKQAAMDLFDEAIGTGNAFGYNGAREQAYEQAFAQYFGGGYADAVNSGTSAIFVALGALDLEPFGEVVVPPITDPGGVMPVPMLNQVPVVADAAPGSFNTGAAEVGAVLTKHTRAIIVAHIAGELVDLDPVLDLARSRGIPVIEDCAQSHGARYKGRLAGTMGTLSAFSTMSGKHHATGAQGGVVFTRDEKLYQEAKRFADRGKPFFLTAPGNVRMGLNLNSNDLSAAIGLVQLRKLPKIVDGRQAAARRIRDGLSAAKAVALGRQVPNTEASYWFLRVELDLARLRLGKAEFSAALAAEGIPNSASYRHIPSEAPWFQQRRTYGRSGCPWTSPEYRGDRDRKFPCPNAVAATDRCFIIGVHENWGEEETRDVVEALLKVERAYLR